MVSFLEGFVFEMKIFSIFYIFCDNEYFWCVLNSDLGDELLFGVEDFWFKGFGYYDVGSCSFYINDKLIEILSDLNGFKICVLNSFIVVVIVCVFGGVVIFVVWGELYIVF